MKGSKSAGTGDDDWKMVSIGTESVFFNKLKFDRYESTAPGYRGLVGFRIYKRVFTPEVFIAFNYIKGKTGESIEFGNRTDEMVLSYTGVQIGANFYFRLTGS